MITAIYQATASQARTLTDRIKVGVEGVWQLITEAYTSRAWDVLGYSSWDDYCTREFGTSRLRLPREDRSDVVASLRESGLSIRAIAAATGDHYSTVSRELARGVANATPEPVSEIVVEDFGPPDIPLPENFDATYGVGTELDDEPALTAEECEALDETRWCDCGLGTCECLAGECTCTETPAPRITGTDGRSYPITPKTKPADPKRKSLPDAFWRATYDMSKEVKRIEKLSEDDRFSRNADQIAQANLPDLIRARDALQCVIDQLTN